MVTLGTAHPVKFPDAVEKAGIGQALALPAHLADLFERSERCTVLPNELRRCRPSSASTAIAASRYRRRCGYCNSSGHS